MDTDKLLTGAVLGAIGLVTMTALALCRNDDEAAGPSLDASTLRVYDSRLAHLNRKVEEMRGELDRNRADTVRLQDRLDTFFDRSTK